MIWLRVVCASVIALGVYGTSVTANQLDDLFIVEGFSKGYAITAETSKLDTLYKNPAGLAGIDSVQIQTVSTGAYDSEMLTLGLNAAFSLSETISAGLSVPIKHISGIPQTIGNDQGEAEVIGSFSDTQTGLILGLGTQLLPDINVGISGSYLIHRINDDQGQGFGVDVGVQWLNGPLTLAGSVQRVLGQRMAWTTGYNDTIPMAANVGLAYQFFQHQLMGDLTYSSSGLQDVNIGGIFHMLDYANMTYGVRDCLSTRRISLGLTMTMERLNVSYAVAKHPHLGLTHKIGIELR